MLTKNFYSVMRVQLSKKKTAARFISVLGKIFDVYPQNAVFPFEAMKSAGESIQTEETQTNSMTGVRFGSDDTPPTANDYKLGSQITSGLSFTNPAEITYTLSNTCSEYAATYGVTNMSEETIVIKEIGLFSQPSTTVIGGSKTGYIAALVDRTVLDAPVTIPAGQSKQITYTIRFNY